MIKVEQQSFYKFNNIPIVGNGVTKLNDVKGWLICNWEGNVVKYSKKVPKDFSPIDKGGLSVYGLDKDGNVILGMAQYPGDPRSGNPVECQPHFYCELCRHTDSGW